MSESGKAGRVDSEVKPNVLFIIDSFEQGGSERQALQLLSQLHASGQCRVHLACLQNRGSLRAEADFFCYPSDSELGEFAAHESSAYSISSVSSG